MPSTYTDNGGIELIGLGEKAGAWGTTTNNNFSIIDRLTNGVKVLTITGDTTLTTSDGSLSDGMFKLIHFKGTVSASSATITISPQDAQKVYFIQNDTTKDLVFQQGGTSDTATVKTADSGIIFADGGSGSAKVLNLADSFTAQGLRTTGSDDITLDAAGGDFKFSVSDTEILRISNSSSDVIIKPIADEKDIIFQQRDGTEVARIEDNGTFNVVTDKFAINGTAVTSTAAELNILDTATVTAGELNLLDGDTSVGSSITVADSDGIIVNDGGTMKTIPASAVKTYTTAGATSGTVTSVATGNGLTGGTITSSGTLSLKNSFLASNGTVSTGTATSFTASTYPHFISGATTSTGGGTFTVTEADGSTHTLNMRDGDGGTHDTFATLLPAGSSISGNQFQYLAVALVPG